jgi:pimeloyl-ACP methyl ester carboxylesterase
MTTQSISTAVLHSEYLEEGPAHGPVVLLLHGFPDDATSWKQVMSGLAAQGRRAIAPFVRGCGGTKFLRADTPRAGDFAALGQDALNLVDALDLRDITVVGQDWGSPTAEIIAIERPDRVRRLVKLNWYGVYSMAELGKSKGFAYTQLRALWYVWMLNTQMGEMVLKHDRLGLARALWSEWSPSWDTATRDAAIDGVAHSFDGDDWIRVALSAYRTNITQAEKDPAHDSLRERLKEPSITRCPTTIVIGADDGVERSPLTTAALARYFPAGAIVRQLSGIGHFPHREAPEAVVQAVLEHGLPA